VSGASNAADAAERKLIAAHQSLLHAKGLQFDFARAAPLPPPPHWLEVLAKALVAAAPVLKYVFWIGVVVGAAMVLWLAVRDLGPLQLRRRRQAGAATVDWRPERTAALSLLEQADALAAQGRYGDAIHLLLFRSIDDLVEKAPGAAPAAFTSRDIVGAAPMPEEPRQAFARIVEAVERTFFGGRPADGADFSRCRSDYETFAFSEAWR
jgi:hypothetical protein